MESLAPVAGLGMPSRRLGLLRMAAPCPRPALARRTQPVARAHRKHVAAAASTSPGAPAAAGGGALAGAAEALRRRLYAGIQAELEAERATVLQQYAKSSERSLTEEGLILVGLTASPAGGRLYGDFVWRLSPASGALPYHKFQAGDSVLISSKGQEGSAIDGVVLEVAKAHVAVTLSKANSDRASGHRPGTLYRVDRGKEETSWRRQLDALERLSEFHNPDCRGERLVRAVLLGAKQAPKLAAEAPEWIKQRKWREGIRDSLAAQDGINLSQRAAIASALTRSFTLWQGPPGTGKTRTLVALMQVICAAAASTPERQEELGPILAVADTNAAADNILAGLLERGVSVARVGRPAKVRRELQHACLEALAEQTKLGEKAKTLRDLAEESLRRMWALREAGEISESQQKQMQARADVAWSEADALVSNAVAAILGQVQVVVCTCNGAADSRLRGKHFRMVVIDEASQATEASTLVPLVKGAECVVAAGDPKQLPPTVLSQAALRHGLDQPLFTRLAGAGLGMLLLDTQYRMHPGIAAFPSRQFYGGSINTGVASEERPPVAGIPWPSSECPVLFLDCQDGGEQRAHANVPAGQGSAGGGGASYKNVAQAEVAMQALSQVVKDPSVESCAILTPYNGQLRLLTSMIKSSPGLSSRAVTVATVDGAQGREWDVVIFCTVRSNAEGRVGFLADERRLNVAITRPRRGLIVIGDAQTLRKDPNWSAFLSWWERQAQLTQ